MGLTKALFITTFLTALSAHALISSETETASKTLGANTASEVSFEEGKYTLTDAEKKDLQDAIKAAKESGKIKEVKVAAWADREYPSKDTKASKSDVKLAEERMKEVKKYLEKDLKVTNVNTYNMAERPNALEQFIKTPTAKVKDTMEASGAAPRTSDETGLFGNKAQASKAVLMIYVTK